MKNSNEGGLEVNKTSFKTTSGKGFHPSPEPSPLRNSEVQHSAAQN